MINTKINMLMFDDNDVDYDDVENVLFSIFNRFYDVMSRYFACGVLGQVPTD